MSSSTSGTGTGTVKRRKQHVSTACNGCKARKSRCDGFQPQCGQCQSLRLECIYDIQSDGRRALPKTLVDALRQRIAALETLLTSRGISFDEYDMLSLLERSRNAVPESRPIQLTRKTSWVNVDAAADLGELKNREEVDTFGIDRLKLYDGELRQTGPSADYDVGRSGSNDIRDSQCDEASSGSWGVPFNISPSSPPNNSAFLSNHPVIADSPNGTAHFQALLDKLLNPSVASLEAWCRHLPNVTGFTRERHDTAIELFFVHIARWCCILDQSRFFIDMESCLPRDGTTWRKAHYSPMLHNAILALSVGYVGDGSLFPLSLRAKFAERAASFIHTEASRPMISTVLGLVLLAKYHGSAAASELGYLYSGMALRSAQSLGLGVDCSSFVRRGIISESMKSARDNAFYVCYIMDKFWSFHAGRAAILNMPVHDITISALPEISMQDDLSLMYPVDQESSSASGATHDERSWKSTTFRETVKLAYIAERILKIAYSLHLNVRSAQVNSVISEINLMLETWSAELPKPLRIVYQNKAVPPSHILMLHLIHQYLVIMLYRPFHSVTAVSETDVPASRCLKASARITQILDLYETSPGLRFCSDFMIHIAFAAGNIQLAFARSTRISESRKSADAVEVVCKCAAQLAAMGQTWPLAEQFSTNLRALVDAINQPSPMRSGPELPMDQPANSSMQVMLQSRPELIAELQSMGWTPPQGAMGVIVPPTAGIPSTSDIHFNPFDTVRNVNDPFGTTSNSYPSIYTHSGLETNPTHLFGGDDLSLDFINSLLQNNP